MRRTSTLPSGIVLAPRIVKFLHQELTLSHSTWILSTVLPHWDSRAIPPVYPQRLCTSFPECLSLRFQLLKNSGNAASCRKSSLTAHPQALVLWPFVRVSDTHTGSGQGIHITQPVIPPPGQTEANSSLGLLGQAKCCGKVAGNWKRPECVPGSITGGLGKWLLLPESYFLFVVSASSLLALWAGDGDPLQRCHQEPSDTVFTWPSLGPFLLRNSPMLLGFLPVLPQ